VIRGLKEKQTNKEKKKKNIVVALLSVPMINRQGPMSSERDSFAKGIFSTFAKGFLLHKLLLKVNYSPLRVKQSRSHDMGQCFQKTPFLRHRKVPKPKCVKIEVETSHHFFRVD
jgi:hypothetical protein